jgi:hypothetical protein
MRKTITAITIALSAIGAANAAQPEAPKQSFSLDGYTYVYEVKADAKGQTITGVRYPDATPFTLTVKGNRIDGVSNDQPVAFSLAEAKGAAKGAVSE